MYDKAWTKANERKGVSVIFTGTPFLARYNIMLEKKKFPGIMIN